MPLDWMRSCLNWLKVINLDVGKLGVVIESFKIVLQQKTIKFQLHVSLMYFCCFVMD